jgi:hypothetical protein
MTERTSRANWDADQHYRHHLEMQEKRRLWEENRKREREQQDRAAKRVALERYLQERSQDWLDHTGTTPPIQVVEGWQRRYMDEQTLAREAEREARLAAAEENYEH